jgi:demethylspheroidene O-methyltransferase
MAASQPMVAEEVLAAYDFAAIAACSMSAAAAAPSSPRRGRARDRTAADAVRPAGGGRAGPRALRAARTRARAPPVHGGDFTRTRCRSGADLVSLVRVLHDHDDDVVMACCAACAPRCRLAGAC